MAGQDKHLMTLSALAGLGCEKGHLVGKTKVAKFAEKMLNMAGWVLAGGTFPMERGEISALPCL